MDHRYNIDNFRISEFVTDLRCIEYHEIDI